MRRNKVKTEIRNVTELISKDLLVGMTDVCYTCWNTTQSTGIIYVIQQVLVTYFRISSTLSSC